MSSNTITRVRNIGIIAHIDAGKTTTTERFLFYSGKIHRMGEVHDGQAAMDYRPDERERGITIWSAATTFYWKDSAGDEIQLNLIDTPGHVDFTAEVERSLRVLDGAVVIFDSVSGVEPQSETVWHQADRYAVPRICFINKMDRVGADYFSAVEDIRVKLGGHPVPIVVPAGEAEEFRGVVDVLRGVLVVFDPDSQGASFERRDVPPELAEVIAEHRRRAVEAIAESDDRLLEKYLAEEPIEFPELLSGLRRATLARKIVPVFCGSALRNVGIQLLLDAVCDLLPSPLDVPPVEGHDPDTGARHECPPDPEQPFVALVFKVTYRGSHDRAYVRVYSGKCAVGRNVFNARSGRKERVQRILRMHANHGEQLQEMQAGDIVAVVGLRESATGDTLSTQEHGLALESIRFPETVVSVAAEPRTVEDREKLDDILARLSREDPTFTYKIHPDTGQLILSGMGELHLEVLRDRMERDFGVRARFGKPRVAYKETLAGASVAEARFQRTMGGQQVESQVALAGEPLERGQGVVVRSELSEGALGAPLVDAMADHLRGLLESGGKLGYPMTDSRLVLRGATVSDVQTPEVLLMGAATNAFRQLVETAGTDILEPVMELTVRAPEEYVGALLRDLHGRRAEIRDSSVVRNVRVIEGVVPLAEMFGYSNALRTTSQGRASYSMEPLEYRAVPPEVARRVFDL